MRKLIKVNKRHIRDGQPGIADRCPVALAIREATGQYAAIRPDHIDVVKGLLNVKQVKTPRSVRRFVNKFDRTDHGSPFNFYLDV